MNQHLHQLIVEGARAGDSARVQSLILALLRDDPRNAKYWAWLSLAAKSDPEIDYCLRVARSLDPGNANVLRAAAYLRAQATPQPNQKPDPNVAGRSRRRLHFDAPKLTAALVAAVLLLALTLFLGVPSAQSELADAALGSTKEADRQLPSEALAAADDRLQDRFDFETSALELGESGLPMGGSTTSWDEDRNSPAPGVAVDDGLLESSSTTRSRYLSLPDFQASWAQRDHYDWTPSGHQVSDFTLRATAIWESAGSVAHRSTSGCGFVFRLNARGDHYLLLYALDGRVHLYRNLRGAVSKLAQGYFGELASPAEGVHLELAVRGELITAGVDGRQVLEHEDDRYGSGLLGYAIASGTNEGFGTRCTLSQIELTDLGPVQG